MAERSLTFGSFRLDLFQNRLWREAQPIALRPQAFAVLRYLVLHADRLVMKAELLQHVWGGRQVTDSVLRGCIHAIRVALADTAATPQYLDTVGRLGYQFRLGRAATRLRPAQARPVVGRQGEVEWLQERWLWAREGRRQCAMLSGETGIGKTTVVDLFVARLTHTGRGGARAGAMCRNLRRGGTVSADVGSLGAARAVPAPRGSPDRAPALCPDVVVAITHAA